MTDNLKAAARAVLTHRWPGDAMLGKGAEHATHAYSAACAVCTGDVAAILAVALPAIFAAADDAVLDSPQAREWLANTKEPVGPGRVDTLAALQQRIDAAVPGAVTELRAAVAERDERIACHVEEADLLRAALDRAGVELAAAKARIEDASLVRNWVNEDGKRFAFADDLLAALHPELAAKSATTPAVPEKETTP